MTLVKNALNLLVARSGPPGISFPTGGANRVTYSGSAVTLPIDLLKGDLVAIFAFNQSSNTIPSLDTDYTSINTEVRTTVNAGRLAYRKVNSNGEFTTTGNGWTNATRLALSIYRPLNGAIITVGSTTKGNNTSATLTTPALTTPDSDGWGINFSGTSASVTYDAGVTKTIRDGTGGTQRTAIFDSNGVTSGTFGTQTITLSTSTGWISISAELIVS